MLGGMPGSPNIPWRKMSNVMMSKNIYVKYQNMCSDFLAPAYDDDIWKPINEVTPMTNAIRKTKAILDGPKLIIGIWPPLYYEIKRHDTFPTFCKRVG